MPRPRNNIARPVNDEEVLRELDRRTKVRGQGQRLAEELGIDSAHLRSMKSGRRVPSWKVAKGLGFELRWVKRE